MILDRRALFRVAGVAAAAFFVPAAAQPATGFAPPAGPMVYTRRLERSLAGGARLVVARSFAVRFVREGEGYRVDGDQVSVEVEAPAQIESLARLERERVESGLFPMRLDAAGVIRGEPQGGPSAQLDAAVREAAAQIEQWQRTPDEREQLRAFVDTVHRSAGRLATELPRDLFAPVDSQREETRAVALPGGDAGQVSVRFTATRDPATGLMREARREVVTEVAGDARRTIEDWTLTLA